MTEEWSFPEGFSFSFLWKPKGKEVSPQEVEATLLARLAESETRLEKAIWELAGFYHATGRAALARKYLERLIANADDPEKQAHYYLSLGQTMERIQDFEAAVSFYSQALSMEQASRPVCYFINNNLGYCLNHLGKHREAEAYCRAAIEIEPSRYNAWKNLGVALEGQQQFAEAARCYISAVKAEASDARALRHLEDLIARHSEISSEIPDLSEQVQKCRDAVRMAMRFRG